MSIWSYARRKLLFQMTSRFDRIEAAIEDQASQTARAFEAIRLELHGIRYAASFASKVGFNGDGENLLYRSLVGGESPVSTVPVRIPLTSSLCRQIHFTLDQYRFWVAAMKDRPKFLRKQWEFFFIAQALWERGLLQAGRKGLAFGVGIEPLPALFASFGAEVLATDQSFASAEAAGWVKSSEHSTDLSALNVRGICTDRMFSQLVSFAEVDMNAIPGSLGGFDFCWSACSLEHLGSLRHGLDFIRNSIPTLRPGGIAVHTTEFNIGSDDATIEGTELSVYRRRDIEALVAELERDGHSVEPIDWTLGEGMAETVVDLPPWGRGEPHMRLLLGTFACTSIALIIQRGAS